MNLKYKKLSIIHLIILIFIAPQKVLGADFYQKCVMGYDFGTREIGYTIVTPIKKACIDLCDVECKSFSRKVSSSSGNLLSEAEINSDVITKCQLACKKGESFKSRYYEASESGGVVTYTAKSPITINGNCSKINNPYDDKNKTNLEVSDGDEIRVAIAQDQDNPKANKIYQCGTKSVTLRPIFKSLSPSSWDNESSQTMWPNKFNHMCFVDYSDSLWNSLTNKSLWQNPNATACKWSARNSQFTNTGIYLMEGDEISISWTGDYSYHPNKNATAINFNKYGNRKNLIDCMQDPKLGDPDRRYYTSDAVSNKCPEQWRNISALTIQNPIGAQINLYGEDARMAPIDTVSITYEEPDENKREDKSWNGLRGFVEDIGLEAKTNPYHDKCKDTETSYKDPDCKIIEDPGLAYYEYKGILKAEDSNMLGFRFQRPQLRLRHYDQEGSNHPVDDNWQDNIGGYEVRIDWGGCPIADGERLQYAVIPDGVDLDTYSPSWKDIPKENIESHKYFEVSTSEPGKVYFRVKPASIPAAGLSAEARDLYQEPANRSGQYYVVAEKKVEQKSILVGGPIQKILNKVEEVILSQSYVVETLVGNVISNNSYRSLLLATIILYICFLGTSFLIGATKMDQNQALIVTVKIAFVIAILTPESWEFFGRMLVDFFVKGALILVYLVASASFKVQNIDMESLEVFSLFDAPITQMFSEPVWKKIYGLVTSSLIGFMTAAIIVVSIVMYIFAIAKVVVMFIYGIVGTSVLISVTPVFLPMVLFQQTKNLFENWWKYLLSFALQPVFVFSAIALFNILLLSLLYSTLNFTVCPFCLFRVVILDIYDECWIPGYNVLMNSHLPEGVTSSMYAPIGALSGGLALLLVSYSAYKFTSEIGDIANRIISGNQIRSLSIGSAGNKAEGLAHATAKYTVSTTADAAKLGAAAVSAGATAAATETATQATSVARKVATKVGDAINKIRR